MIDNIVGLKVVTSFEDSLLRHSVLKIPFHAGLKVVTSLKVVGLKIPFCANPSHIPNRDAASQGAGSLLGFLSSLSSLSLYVYIYIYTCLSIYLSIYLSISLNLYVYVYTYIYIYIYLSLSIYIYIYIYYKCRAARGAGGLQVSKLAAGADLLPRYGPLLLPLLLLLLLRRPD